MMKKILTGLGTFILIILGISTLFKFQHWPGASALFVVSMTLYISIFLPVFFIDRINQNKSGLNIATNILGLISTTMIFSGVLFKFQHWPGASFLLVIGTMLFVLPTLILYFVQQVKEFDKKFSEFWRTITIGILASVFLLFWGLNLSRSVLRSFLKVEDAVLKTNSNLIDYNSYILNEIRSKSKQDSVNYITSKNIHSSSLALYEYIEKLKQELIYETEKAEPPSDHWMINSIDNYDIPTFMLGSADSQKGNALYDSLFKYNNNLKKEMSKLSLVRTNESLDISNFEIDLSVNEKLTEGYRMNWNMSLFLHQTLAASLCTLTSLQNDVLNAEFNCLRSISNNTN